MKRTTNKHNNTTPGFAIRLTEQSDLGIAMLIAEDEAGAYQPIGPVSMIAEGRDIAQQDMRFRMRQLERGAEPFCPEVYKVWARGVDGDFAVAAEFEASTL